MPPWLARRMERLGRVIVEALVLEHGRDEVLRRLAHPFWFQSFGAVMGMDWHSSGITTSVVGALKRGLAPVSAELGLHICGGRGRHSRRTPDELLEIGARTGVDGADLGRRSRLVAKVDSAAVQDGYDLYLHCFVVTDDGKWVVVQQGMDPRVRQARRYHWLGEGVRSFVDAPHAAIEGHPGSPIVNLTDHRAAPSRGAQVALISEGPDKVLREARRILGERAVETTRPLPHLAMPPHHEVRASDVRLRRLHAGFRAAAERGPKDFLELMETPGVGARTVRALALVAEVLHGTPARFSDPARFSFAHGGKDGHPFPVPLQVYDHTLGVLRQAVARARLGQDDRLAALRRLDEEARRIDRAAAGLPFDAIVAEERRDSGAYGGHSVFGPVPRSKPRTKSRPGAVSSDRQLRLPGLG